MQFLWENQVTFIYYGGSENDYKFDHLVLRLPKKYVFLRMKNDHDFFILKSLLEEEDYRQD